MLTEDFIWTKVAKKIVWSKFFKMSTISCSGKIFPMCLLIKSEGISSVENLMQICFLSCYVAVLAVEMYFLKSSLC